MTTAIQSSMMAELGGDDRVFRKVFRRIIWFLFILLVVSFMDRINIAFAALTMNKDLGLNAAAYGMSLTVFYIAYTLFEIPSNLILAKVGARLWMARIMITWGLASAATMFAVGMWSLYGIRALVGIAEAGFLPGILLYLTYWFPRTCRARANALFIMGIPATIAIASTLSGVILQMHGIFGLAGWRWLFLLEGLPAVVLGVICLFYLDDGPAHANWLSDEEKREIASRLERDRALEQTAATQRGILSQLGSRNVLLLSAAYFGLVTSLNANSTWVPQIVHGFAHSENFAVIGLLTALPAVLTVAIMPLWGASSDRRNELGLAPAHRNGGCRNGLASRHHVQRAGGALSGTDHRFGRLVLRVAHVLDIPRIVSDSVVRSATRWDRAYQLCRYRWRLGHRSARCGLSQRSYRELHRRASLCRGDADHGRDLHHYRGRTDPHCNADAEPKRRLTATTSQP